MFSVLIREFQYSSFPQKISLINLNSAGIEDLVTLPGMGYNTAIKIIVYRENHGPFKNLDGLLKIEGVSIKKLKKWKPYFKISDTKTRSKPQIYTDKHKENLKSQ